MKTSYHLTDKGGSETNYSLDLNSVSPLTTQSMGLFQETKVSVKGKETHNPRRCVNSLNSWFKTPRSNKFCPNYISVYSYVISYKLTQ